MGDFRIRWRGTAELRRALTQLGERADRATVEALRESQEMLEDEIRRGLQGPPRWGQRGRSARTGPAVRVGDGGHRPRGGGPGVLTGAMLEGVGGVRRPKRHGAAGWQGGVGVGGGRINRLKKGRLEARFPYFRPAVARVTPRLQTTFERAWSRAVHRS